jgi:hypothetical protein
LAADVELRARVEHDREPVPSAPNALTPARAAHGHGAVDSHQAEDVEGIDHCRQWFENFEFAERRHDPGAFVCRPDAHDVLPGNDLSRSAVPYGDAVPADYRDGISRGAAQGAANIATPTDAVAQRNDGTSSHATGRRRSCFRHAGVSKFLKE